MTEDPATPRPAATGTGGRTSAALSLVMHAVLLAALIHATSIPITPGQPEGLTVDILQAEAPPTPEEKFAPPPEPEPEPAKPEPPAPKLEPPAPKPALPQPKPAQPRPPTLPRPVAEPPAAPPEPSTASGTENGVGVAAVHSPPPAAPMAGAAAPDDALRLYGQMVWSRISAHKPRGVRLPGTVSITFTIGPDGGLLAAEIARDDVGTSLGQIAMDTVRRAAPFPPPPPGAPRHQMTFVIPFQFR